MNPASADINTMEEPEEGEIVDDLEVVSDCSMSSGSRLYSGKSVSPPELLSAVCLSSISTSEYSTTTDPVHYCSLRNFSTFHYEENLRNEISRHHHHHHRSHKRRRESEDSLYNRRSYKHRRKSFEAAGTDSENEVVDPKYAKKLRAALRRESSSQDLLQSSLRTRLKGYFEPDSQTEDDLSLATLRELVFSTIKNPENVSTKQEDEMVEPLGNDSNSNDAEQNQDENENELLSDLEPPELDEIPIILDSIDNVENDGNKDKNCETNNRLLGNTDDNELHELRLAALKTVIMEKHKQRKKKVAGGKVNDMSIESDKIHMDEVDKENDKSMINNDVDNKITDNQKNVNCDTEKSYEVISKEPTTNNLVDVVNDQSSIDETNCSDCVNNLETEDDADIIRAVLLANMTKKLADKTLEDNKSKPFGELTLSGIRKVEKSKTNLNSLTVTIAKPQPLLKTIKNDIYDRPAPKIYLNANTNHLINLRNKINEQPHCDVKPLIIQVTNDSDSDTETSPPNENNQLIKDTVAEFLKKQRAEVEAGNAKLIETSLNKSDDVLSDKSVVKLLPRSQQLEYRRLKQLLNTRKRTRIRKLSQRVMENNICNNATSVLESTKTSADVEKKIAPPTDNLQKTLSDLQIKKNGRLQMKGKYRSLGPLLNRINQASNEREQHGIEIKTLLRQIEKSRMKLAASHQDFANLVQQLVSEKNKIDKRVFKTMKPQSNMFTSTPNKFVKKIQTNNITSSKINNKVTTDESNNVPVANSTIQTKQDHSVEENNKIISNEVNDLKRDDIAKQQDEVLLMDPNDVDKVFVEQPIADLATFPKYISPLGGRDGINDPLTAVCPYDLLGTCKDKECRYMHCS